MAIQNETNYIYLVYKNNLIKEMEQEFEIENPMSKATFKIDSNHKYIRIVVADRSFKFIKSYTASNFDCVADSLSMMDYSFKEHPKSEKTCLDSEIRKFYLRFMKKHFAEYIEDFKANLIKQADLDLGETSSC